jgi:nucleotide-binding universal stress UspA family protein
LAKSEVDEMAMHLGNHTDTARDDVVAEATPFRRMLVAIDGSKAAQAACNLVAEWVGAHGADLWFVQVTEERRQRHSGLESDVDPIAVEPANHVVVSGPTLGARNRQLVRGIAEAADAFGADVVVLGFERARLAGHRLAPSLREQITRATDLPVMVAPTAPPESKRHLRVVPEPRRSEERAPEGRRHAHV